MAGREQGVPALIGGNGMAIVTVIVAAHILTVLIVGVNLPAPCNHVNGIVVEQFQLGSKFGDVVSGAGAGGQQLHPAAAEAGQG